MWQPLTTSEILAARGPKAVVDSRQPQAYLCEQERTAAGTIEPVATLFLTNRECPYRCLFCDLWRHTLDDPTPAGAIPAQIRFALKQLPATRHIKLYNSGNFFDPRAIPVVDHPTIADLVDGYATVIVENHPRMVGPPVWEFQARLSGTLEVALGLETAQPKLLAALNKQMTVADYQTAARELRGQGCQVRTFLIQRLPGQTEREGIESTVRSIEVAFAAGSGCVSVIPFRGGNGAVETLSARGVSITPPSLAALYETHGRALELSGGRVFVDLWNLEALTPCPDCGHIQRDLFETMNHTQTVQPWRTCARCATT